MNRLKKPYIILLLFILVTFVLTHDSKSIAIEFGHAVPDKYTLKPNSLIETQQVFPSNISILFSEKPDPKVSYIHVIDSTGQRIDNDDFKISDQSGREGSVSIDRNLIEEGVYSISWLTLSLDDGHVTKGTYVVGIGNSGSLEAASQNIFSTKRHIFSNFGCHESSCDNWASMYTTGLVIDTNSLKYLRNTMKIIFTLTSINK